VGVGRLCTRRWHAAPVIRTLSMPRRHRILDGLNATFGLARYLRRPPVCKCSQRRATNVSVDYTVNFMGSTITCVPGAVPQRMISSTSNIGTRLMTSLIVGHACWSLLILSCGAGCLSSAATPVIGPATLKRRQSARGRQQRIPVDTVRMPSTMLKVWRKCSRVWV